MELASYHTSGSWNFEVKFLKPLSTPAVGNINTYVTQYFLQFHFLFQCINKQLLKIPSNMRQLLLSRALKPTKKILHLDCMADNLIYVIVC